MIMAGTDLLADNFQIFFKLKYEIMLNEILAISCKNKMQFSLTAI
jgi:hypothetical protein